mmetsp:Transcript_22549/g.34078  ORF Transcript_22549/g.34078 Transcript_22549/m.34078 type:complete len:162 (-) Transcript_22549:364-849(-)
MYIPTTTLLPKIMHRNRDKKRAVSFDRTIETDISVDACEVINDTSKCTSICEINRTISSSQNEDRVGLLNQSTAFLDDQLYKNDIVLKNRVAAFSAQQKLLGKHHPDVLFSLQNLAGLLYRRGEYDHAHRVFKEYNNRQEQSNQSGKQMQDSIPSEIFLHL